MNSFNNKIQEILTKNHKELSDEELSLCANKLRMDVVTMVYEAASGHTGGALGLADIFATLYLKILNLDPQKPEKSDRFLLSNGHVCAILYSALAMTGVIPSSELNTFRKLGTRLQGHPSTHYLPQLYNSSGSLGQGLSQACGAALGMKLQKHTGQLFIGISDGECQEGMTWEAAMSIAHYKLDNLTAFVDYNHIQIDGKIEEVMNLGILADKFTSFGWLTRNANGHSFPEIRGAFQWGKQKEGKPKIILFENTLGKNVSFMENNPKWHGTPPDKEQYEKAMNELLKLA
ncbi:MAG: transketolase [Spirochaetia bacterium]|nr:transketolase [Spirochaetia bacterium]